MPRVLRNRNAVNYREPNNTVYRHTYRQAGDPGPRPPQRRGGNRPPPRDPHRIPNEDFLQVFIDFSR